MRQTVDVYECTSGVSKKGNTYHVAVIKAEGGRVGKIFSDVKLETGQRDVEISITPNQEMVLSARITKDYDAE